MLERTLRFVFLVPGQMHLSIFAGDVASPVHQDRGILTVLYIALECDFGVAEAKTHAERRCGLE